MKSTSYLAFGVHEERREDSIGVGRLGERALRSLKFNLFSFQYEFKYIFASKST